MNIPRLSSYSQQYQTRSITNDGLIAVAIGEAAEQSIKEGRVVQMSEFNL